MYKIGIKGAQEMTSVLQVVWIVREMSLFLQLSLIPHNSQTVKSNDQ